MSGVLLQGLSVAFLLELLDLGKNGSQKVVFGDPP
jgi:hypothetical protein